MALISKPRSNQCSCSSLISIVSSSCFFGHLNLSFSRRLYQRQKPVLCQYRSFSLSRRSLQKQKQRASIERLFHFEFNNRSKAINLFTKIDGVTMQINLWGINKHFDESIPINFASQTTSVELGVDNVALPILRVITVVESSVFSATVTLLKAEDLIKEDLVCDRNR